MSYNYKADQDLYYKVDQSALATDTATTTTPSPSTFGPTASVSSTADAHVYFHLGHTGHEVAPKKFPACVSRGKGVIVREGFLRGAWTCVRAFERDEEDCWWHWRGDDDSNNVSNDGQDDNSNGKGPLPPPRSVTFPADPSTDTPAHMIRIVGCRVIEFSVLAIDGAVAALDDGDSGTAAQVENARFIRLRVKALVAAANEEFSPKGGTEGCPIWIGVDEFPENIFGFGAVVGQQLHHRQERQQRREECGMWEVKCDDGEVVRF
ncbi:hypothetical protein AYO20_09247 [Fonsecaea nubica]|uniref:Uncharacterized protein n=1 Tax=Fonsecaea nubica TaxID=856822 RepID=A0A178CIM8_9EURO|nr:hypothetical protein AYO20_09247 [Fonsecaea nubica]OAL29194.1 hypothetical protein AYO20_09247 [Fonsecaea nubica]